MDVKTSPRSEDENNSHTISFPSSPFETPLLTLVVAKGLVFQHFLHSLDKPSENDYLSSAFLTEPTVSDVVVSFFCCTHRSEQAAESLRCVRLVP
jgi:hypothetical protein